MLVRKIKNYITQHGGATVLEISAHFNEDKKIVKDILALLVERGDIKKSLPHSHCCSSQKECQSCFIELVEMYYCV